MAPFFRRKSPMDKLETELGGLRSRADTLSARHAAADAAFLDAKAKLQRHHLEADGPRNTATMTVVRGSQANTKTP